MNPDDLELCLLSACKRSHSDEWSGRWSDLIKLLGEISRVDPPPEMQIVQAIMELCRKNQLEVRKYNDNGTPVPLDGSKTADGAYLDHFFFRRDFRMKLTHTGWKRLAADLPPPQPAREKIGF